MSNFFYFLYYLTNLVVKGDATGERNDRRADTTGTCIRLDRLLFDSIILFEGGDVDGIDVDELNAIVFLCIVIVFYVNL